MSVGTAPRQDLLTVAGCPGCSRIRETMLRDLVDNAVIDYRKVDVSEVPEASMHLGILATPVIRVDRDLFFNDVGCQAGLRQAIAHRLRPARNEKLR